MGSIIKVNEYKDFGNNAIMTSDGSGNVTVNASGLQNTPMVSAYMGATQTVSDATFTKIQYNTELYDTDSAYDVSNYKFTVPSGKAGKYLIDASVYMLGNNNDEVRRSMGIYLNGSRVRKEEVASNYSTGQSSAGSLSITSILDLAASDYIEIFGYLDVNSGTPSFYGASAATDRYSVLQIAKMIG